MGLTHHKKLLIFLRGSERTSCFLAGRDFRPLSRLSLAIITEKNRKSWLLFIRFFGP